MNGPSNHQSSVMLPTTLRQTRMWMEDLLHVDVPVNRTMPLLTIRGSIDPKLFERAFKRLVQLHEALRSTLETSSTGDLCYRVWENHTGKIHFVDLSQERTPEEAYQTWVRQRCTKAFSTGEQLYDAALLKLGDEHFIFYFNHYHIVMDGSSCVVLNQDLEKLYIELRDGRGPETPEEMGQPPYSDFIKEFHTYIASQEAKESEAYWEQKLAPQAPPLSYFGRTIAESRAQTKRIRRRLDPQFCQRIRSLGKLTPPLVVFTAATIGYLRRVTGSEDLCLGLPMQNRSSEFKGTAGLLMEVTPIRIPLNDTDTFDSVIQKVRKDLSVAKPHRRYPVSGDQAGYEVLFNYRTFTMASFAGFPAEYEPTTPLNYINELPADTKAITQKHERVALTIGVEQADADSDFIVVFDFNVGVWPDSAEYERAIDQYLCLVDALVDNKSQQIDRIDLLTDEEKIRLFPGDESAECRGENLPTVVERVASQITRRPNHPAIVFNEEVLTYRELGARVNRLAAYLRYAGVGPNTLVGICIDRTPNLVVGLLAIMRAGGVYVPIDPTLPEGRIDVMLEDSDPALLLSEQRFRHILGPRRQDRTICIDDPVWMEREATIGEGDVLYGDLAYVIFTSGSTGRPKGVQVRHHGLSTFIRAMSKEPGLSEDDRLLAVTTVSFDIAALEFFLPLTTGATVYIAPYETTTNGEKLKDLLAHENITVLQATPATFRMLVDSGWQGSNEIKVLCGGEALPVKLGNALRARAAAVWNMFGPTETTIWSIMKKVDAGASSIPIGRPIPGTQAYVLNDCMEPVPIGVPGELYLAGDGIARGYIGREDLTQERFLPNPFSTVSSARMYRTGDIVRYLPNLDLEFIGRNDFQVKIRGFRIELLEIETVIDQIHAVNQSVVSAIETEVGEHILVAYIVAKKGFGSVSRETVQDHLKQNLPAYMIPATIVQLEAFPLNPSGKIDRLALPTPDTSEIVARDFVAPATELEQAIASVWQRVLQIERVGITDDFFELGGSSLLALRLISEIEHSTGLHIELPEIFKAPTIALLIDTIETTVPIIPAIIRHNGTGPVPASYGQKQMWLEQTRNPESTAYNVAVAIDLGGPLDESAFLRSLNELVARHEVLRTSFHIEGDTLLQKVHANLRLDVSVTDLPSAPDDAALDEVLRNEANIPFDLEVAPPLRAHLFRLTNTHRVLSLTFHHVAVDEWSLDILYSDLSAIYRNEIQGGTLVELPKLTLRYADFSYWQYDLTLSDALNQQLNYWEDKLRGAPAELDLPTDYEPPQAIDWRGGEITFEMPENIVHELDKLARREGTSRFTLLLAAYLVLLSRCTGQDDLVIGTLASLRARPEIQNLVGYFLNTLPIRARVGAADSFLSFWSRVRQDIGDAITNQEVPYPHIVEHLNPARDRYGRPFFQTMFTVTEAEKGALNIDGITTQVHRVPLGTAKANVTLFVSNSSAQLNGRLEYNSSLFDAQTMAVLVQGYSTLLRSIVADPSQPVAELELVPAQVKRTLLAEQENLSVPYPRDASIVELFLDQVAQRAEAVALVGGEETWSYAELDRQSNRIAHRLQELGVGREDLVGVCADRHPWLIAAILGILKAGGAYVPLDPAYPAERLKFILEDTEVQVVLTEPGLLDDLSLGDQVLVELNADSFSARTPDDALHTAAATDLAYVMYTSGSTGTPKGVAVTHRNVVRLVRDANYVELGPDERILQLAPISFDAATFEVWAPLLNGGVCVLYPERELSLEVLERVLTEQRISCLFLTTALFNNVIDQCPTALTNVRQLYFGGEAASIQHAARGMKLLPLTRLANIYGPTEGTTFSTYQMLQRDGASNLSSIPIGKPISNTQIYVLDKCGDLVLPGVSGELYIGGDGVARGYHRRPELTAERFVVDPFSDNPEARLYRTGDRVRQLADGSIAFLGRVDDQIKIRGFRIEPGEVEACLESHALVHQSVVSTYQTPAGEKTMAAYVVATVGTGNLDRIALSKHLKQHLPAYMIPATIVQLEAFPLNPSGKIDRLALPAPDTSEIVARDFVAPATELEQAVASVWQRVLQIERVGITDDFFELGGSSLLALRLISEIEHSTGLHVELGMVFAAPTIRQLVENLGPVTSTLGSLVVPLNKASTGVPIFCLSGIQVYRDLVPALDENIPVLGLVVAEEGHLHSNIDPSVAVDFVEISIDRLADEYCATILRHQPNGPYRLAGLSFGGVLAIEVASRLQSQGKNVEIVLLFDTALPKAVHRRMFKFVLHVVTRIWRGQTFKLFERLLKRRNDPVFRFARHLFAEKLFDGDHSTQAIEAIKRASRKAMEEYAGPPAAFDGQVVLFKAKDNPSYLKYDYDYGWSPQLCRDLVIYEVPGDHLNHIAQPNVGAVAEKIHAHLSG